MGKVYRNQQGTMQYLGLAQWEADTAHKSTGQGRMHFPELRKSTERADKSDSLQWIDSANPAHLGREGTGEQIPQRHSPPSSSLLPQCLSSPPHSSNPTLARRQGSLLMLSMLVSLPGPEQGREG